MSEFHQAIAWRGPSRLSFIVYALWGVEDEHLPDMGHVQHALAEVVPGSEVSLFIATDEWWPCRVGVFDIEFEGWPNDVEGSVREMLARVCAARPQVAWLMFDGVFNDIGDIFSSYWSTHIYAIRGDCGAPVVDLAIADEDRHSARWAEVVAKQRARVLRLFPDLGSQGPRSPE